MDSIDLNKINAQFEELNTKLNNLTRFIAQNFEPVNIEEFNKPPVLIYWIDNNRYSTNDYSSIPFDEISSPNEQTPAYENTLTGNKCWYNKGGIPHRLTGPAVIGSNKTYEFWLNGKLYHTVQDWLNAHPDQSVNFQTNMLMFY
jgi:hypothetical protein